MRYVLDTHALVWYLTGDMRLGAAAQHILNNGDNQLIVPAIVLAEAKHIADRKRVPVPFSEIIQAIVSMPQCTVLPLDIFTVSRLPAELDIHDSLIVATALYCQDFFGEEIIILTNDLTITHSGLVQVIW